MFNFQKEREMKNSSNVINLEKNLSKLCLKKRTRQSQLLKNTREKDEISIGNLEIKATNSV